MIREIRIRTRHRKLPLLVVGIALASAVSPIIPGRSAWGSPDRRGSTTDAAGAMDADAPGAGRERVVLIHGLGRSGRSLWLLQQRIEAAGHATQVISYASTEHTLAELASGLDAELAQCCDGERLHFVTHSMGGIVLREWLARSEPAASRIGRVVMLSPPNHGSALVDVLGRTSRILGPAGRALGTGSRSAPSRLNAAGAADFEVGIIAGNRSLNFLGSWILEGPDDGTVSVASARLTGMRDFLVLPTSHSFMLYDREVARQALHFLSFGGFDAL